MQPSGGTGSIFLDSKLREFEEHNVPEEHRLFVPLRELTAKGKTRVGKKNIRLEGLAGLGVGNFFVFLSSAFLSIYLLITVYSFFIPSLPLLFRDP